MTTEKYFAHARDQFQRDGAAYLDYLKKINDFPNLELLYPEKFIKKIKHKDCKIKILDLACGPGNAGTYLAAALGKELMVKDVSFVDINTERLKEIKELPVPKRVVEGEIIDFLKQEIGHYTVAVFRYAVYYFVPELQRVIINSIYQRLSSPGCVIIGSFGATEREADFLTELHRRAMAANGINYLGRYLSKDDLFSLLEGAGFGDFEVSEGLTTWYLKDFSQKFNLPTDQVRLIEEWVRSEASHFGVSTQQKEDLLFNVSSFVVKGIKS